MSGSQDPLALSLLSGASLPEFLDPGQAVEKNPNLGLCSRLTFLQEQAEMEALQSFRLSVLVQISHPLAVRGN